MTSKQFFNALKRYTKKYKATWRFLDFNTKIIRTGCDCPITFVYHMKFGEPISPQRAAYAGKCLKMDRKVVDTIIAAADGQSKHLITITKLLKACGL